MLLFRCYSPTWNVDEGFPVIIQGVSGNAYRCISGKPDHDAGKMDESEEAACEFDEACGDAPVLFELLKEALDQVARLIQDPVAGPRFLVRLGRDEMISARGDEIPRPIVGRGYYFNSCINQHLIDDCVPCPEDNPIGQVSHIAS